MSRHHHPAPSLPTAPADPAGLSRRERRAAARGGPAAARVAGPPASHRIPVPNRQRDYATRRRG